MKDIEDRLRDIEYMIARLCMAQDYGSSRSNYNNEWWGIRTGEIKRGDGG